MKFKKVNIVGYYDHDNLGDEQYKYTITHLLRKIDKDLNVDNIRFIDCDKINKLKLDPTDFYVLGGGDVLIDYFLDKLQFFNEEKFKNTKIIALSAGLPYYNYGIVQKMKFIDYFFLRSKDDVDYLQKIFPGRVFYLPDLSLLNNNIKINNLNIDYKVNNSLKNILICPTQFSKNITVRNNFKIFLHNLINELSKHYNIYLFPFGENDEKICNELYSNLRMLKKLNAQENQGSLYYICSQNKYDCIINLLKNVNFHYSIPMRYHSLLFSFMHKIPFFPIFSTAKIYRFLKDIEWRYQYYIADEHFELKKTLQQLSDFSDFCSNKQLNSKLSRVENNLYNGIEQMHWILNSYTKNNVVLKNVKTIKNEVLYFIQNKELNNDLKEFLVKLVSYRITDSTNSVYNWGLFEKMFREDFNWESEIAWVINDHYINKKIEHFNEEGFFNMNYFNQEDFSKTHRAGWNYVYEHLIPYHSNSSDLILDLYLDRTFGWDYEINSYLNLIPYKKTWTGFIHHTFDAKFSKYNIYEYFEKENFLKSLKYCRGLFVLSKYLKKQLEHYLKLFNYKIPVHYIAHPTDFDVIKFKMCKFDINNFKLVHIGGWLRNVYSFYKLSGIKNKYLLKGKSMNNYVPPENFDIVCEKNDIDNIYKHCSKNCSTDKNCRNQWIKDLKTDIDTTINSVKIIDHISNDEFDELLSKNVVFINLHDGSAVNTIIECIVRNTPIVVNRTEFTEELLGKNYPLFYNNYVNDFNKTNNEIKKLLTRYNIFKGYLYLKCFNKEKYRIDYFIENFLQYFD